MTTHPSLATRNSILIVDPDADTRGALYEYLARYGYDIRLASNGNDMDDLLTRHLVDLVILDRTMRGEDGLSICRRLSRASLRILILSARSSIHDKVVVLEAGADDFMCKPPEPRELLARVRALLRRHTPQA